MKAADIAAITNETYATVASHFSAKTVTTAMGARVSVPYCVAVAALDREVGQAQFAPERVARARRAGPARGAPTSWPCRS